MKDVLEIRRRKTTIIEEARGLLDKAEAEERVFTDAETEQYDKLIVQVEGMAKQETRLLTLYELEGASEVRSSSSEETRTEVTDPAAEKRFATFGEQLLAVAEACRTGGRVDNRLIDREEYRAATGLSESIPAEGGFLVQLDFATELIKRVYETALLASRCRKIPIGANFNGIKLNGIDESSRVDGSRWGGVRAYWADEAEEKTKSKPKFRQIELNLKKLIGLCYATDEILQDATALEAIIREAFTEEFAFKVDDAVFTGTGAGQPLGIMNSGSLVPVPKETNQAAATIEFANISKMWARMRARNRANAVWFVNQDVEPELDNLFLPVGTGGSAVYLPAGGLSASPYASLKGRPVIAIEHCETLGTVGDIVLADLSQYLLADKGGIQTASSIHVRFEYDESVFRFVYRVDGKPMWSLPLTPYKGASTLSPFVALATRS